MARLISICVHESEFPDRFAADCQAAFRNRRIPPKLHYQSLKQTQRWLRLFDAYSPFVRDTSTKDIYAQAGECLCSTQAGDRVVLVSLGCGGGQKEVQLVDLFHAAGRKVVYVPMDVSPGMVITAAGRMEGRSGCEACHPLVVDLTQAADLPQVLAGKVGEKEPRILTFFGMIPNFEPNIAGGLLSSLLRPQDRLASSANLAPGDDYDAGVRQILPQYDNELTREWLTTLLHDSGFEHGDGELRFRIESRTSSAVRMVVADYHVRCARTLQIGGEIFPFHPGDVLQVFFSCRYTPALVTELLAQHGISIAAQWIAAGGEEGLFICRRKP